MDDIKKKIAALIAKAQGTDNEHEAAAFMMKAEELMDRHQLEIWQLGDKEDKLDEEVMLTYTDATPSLNDHKLLTACARYYGCRVITSRRYVTNKRGRRVVETQYVIIARESARVTTRLMFPFVMQQCKDAGRRLSQAGHGSANKMALRVVNALVSRIYNLKFEADARNERDTSATGNVRNARALVVVNELESYMESKHADLLPGKKSRTVTTTLAARAEANKINLHRQIDGDNQLKLGHG